MKTTIISSFALWVVISLCACKGNNSNNGYNGDSTASINKAPAPNNTESNMPTRDSSMTGNRSGTNEQTVLDENSRSFMNDAAMGGMAEVEMGKLAEQNSMNPRVKAFGEMMVKDHSNANDDLKSIARNKNVMLPDNLGAKHMHHKEELASKKGAEFDKAYMKMMVEDHKEDIEAFEKTSRTATDPDVKNFASQKLPILRTHLDSAKAINSSLSNEKSMSHTHKY